MKKTLTSLTMGATSVALAAGTLVMTAGAAHADRQGLEGSMRTKALFGCAVPYQDQAGHADLYVPDYLPIFARDTIKGDADSTAPWALVETILPTRRGADMCLVIEIPEPAGVQATSATVRLTTVDPTDTVGIAVINPNIRQEPFDQAYAYLKNQASHEFTNLTFADVDEDPSTPRVAQFAGKLDDYPPSLTATVTVDGKKVSTTTVDVAKQVVVARTPAEKSAALAVHRAEVKKAHAAHSASDSTIRRTKSKARAEARRSGLTSNARKAALKAIDKKFRKQYKAAAASCDTARSRSLAAYSRAIAPYPTMVVGKGEQSTSTPYSSTVSGTIYELV